MKHVSSEELDRKFRDHVALTSDSPIGWIVDRAEGPYIYLADGSRCIDLISGIAVSSIGHRHPHVVGAIKDQIARHLHVMVYGEFVIKPQAELAERLAGQLGPGLDTVYFTMTGTEANEGALKVARKATGRTGLVAFHNSYHGDTCGSLSVTGRSVYREPFEPLLPDVRFLAFGETDALAAIDESVAAVITEPIQGEGGIVVPPDDWLPALRARCTDVGALLILDEIQTGFGRTGKLFAHQSAGITPDLLSIAKAFGGGMPLGAFIGSRDVMASIRRDPPLSHVTTFGGHPVSCAAALAALEVILDEGLAERAIEIEKFVRARLVHPKVVGIRGRGAMLGMTLADRVTTRRCVSQCLDKGVLLGWTLHSDTLVRIAPPLNIDFGVLGTALDIVVGSLDSRIN